MSWASPTGRSDGGSSSGGCTASTTTSTPEIPKPLCNIEIDHWEIDCFWPEHNLAVELDGRPYHVAAGAMEKDRIKDAALLRRGITPLRFTEFRVAHDLGGILRDLYHFLEVV